MSGLLTGYATHKTAKEIGAAAGFPAAGEAIGDILGAVVGGKVAGAISPEAVAHVENLLKTRGIGAVRSWLQGVVTPATETEGGFKVNPSILRKTASGGPAPVEYRSVGRPERVGGAVAPPVPEPPEDVTFTPGLKGKQNLKYGGSVTPPNSSGSSYTRRGSPNLPATPLKSPDRPFPRPPVHLIAADPIPQPLRDDLPRATRRSLTRKPPGLGSLRSRTQEPG